MADVAHGSSAGSTAQFPGSSYLDVERRAHEAFAESRRKVYVEQPELLKRLDRFAADVDLPRGLIVTGESGSGKSALLSNWSFAYRRRHADAIVVEHYVGQSNSGRNHLDVIWHLLREIQSQTQHREQLPSYGDELDEELPRWLGLVQNRTLLVVIDGVDQLDDAQEMVSWIPEYIPSCARVLVSLQTLDARTAHLSSWQTLAVEPLSVETRTEIVHRHLARYNADFNRSQIDRVVSSQASANPLFLRTSLGALTSSGSPAEQSRRLDSYLGASNVAELFELILTRLEDTHGAASLRDLSSALWAVASGLTLDEAAETVGDSNNAARVLRSLDAHLMRRDGAYLFAHEHLRLAVEERYVERTGLGRSALHARIARLFESREITARTAEEILRQWIAGGHTTDAIRCLAEPLLFTALAEAERLHVIVRCWNEIGDRRVANDAYDTCLHAMLAREPASSDEDARHLLALGRVLTALRCFSSADKVLLRARDIWRGSGSRRSYPSEIVRTLAAAHISEGRFGDAAVLVEESLAAETLEHGPDAVEIAESLSILALIQYSLHKPGSAIEALGRARAIQEAAGNEQALIRDTGLLGAAYLQAGNIIAAGEILENALRLSVRVLGESHPETIAAQNNVAAWATQAGRLDEALASFEKSLAANKSLFGGLHVDVAINRSNIATVLYQMRRFEEAIDQYSAAIDVIVRLEDGDSVVLARNLVGRATALADAGRLQEAIIDTERAAAIRVRLLGEEHPETITCRLQVALFRAYAGDVENAIRTYDHWLPIRERVLGAGHPQSELSRARYSELLKLREAGNSSGT
jgi:nephrocystin-3